MRHPQNTNSITEIAFSRPTPTPSLSQMATAQSALFNPPDEMGTFPYFISVGKWAQAMEKWQAFGVQVSTVVGACTVGLVRTARYDDMLLAAEKAGVGRGYVEALALFLAAEGEAPHVFAKADVVKRESSTSGGAFEKKMESQRGRKSLGVELGHDLRTLEFPDGMFDGISWPADKPMKGRGRNSTAAVADRVWQWAILKWGNAHSDALFNDRMGVLLHALWPLLKPWGFKSSTPRERTWAGIIENRFTNARLGSEARPLYKKMEIAQIDLVDSSPVKRSIAELNLTVNESKKSFFGPKVSLPLT